MSKKGEWGDKIIIPPDPKKDARRHETWCWHFKRGQCTKTMCHCIGSAHCAYYEENPLKKK